MRIDSHIIDTEDGLLRNFLPRKTIFDPETDVLPVLSLIKALVQTLVKQTV